MASILHQLPQTVLRQLAGALAAGRIQEPYSSLALSEWLADRDRAAVGRELERLRLAGFTGRQISLVMDLLASEREIQQKQSDRLQMVWTGPDQEGPLARDTGVVVRELLGQAKRSLLLTTYSLSRDTNIFRPVHSALEKSPDLDVTLILHINLSQRALYGNAAVSAFAKDFWSHHWPWKIRPKVFFDPRGVREDRDSRANQHAKCIVVDGAQVLITSANYTEWAQTRNIELGVVFHNEVFARRVSEKFQALIERKQLIPLPV